MFPAAAALPPSGRIESTRTAPFTVPSRDPKKMKNLKLISTLLLVAITAGCDFGKKEPETIAADTTKQELVDATSAAQKTAEQMRAYAYEQRAEFIKKMNAEVAKLREEAQTLTAKVEAADASAKAEAAPKLDALREQMKLLEKQLVALNGATPTTWEGIKADSLKAYEAVGEGVNQARLWVSEKIAP